jgi:hypothetical protein
MEVRQNSMDIRGRTSDLWTLNPPVAHSHPSLGLAPLKLLPDAIALTERRGSFILKLPSHGRSRSIPSGTHAVAQFIMSISVTGL